MTQKLPRGGSDPRTSVRSLDPVDPSAPPPDGTPILHAILATPRPARRRRGVRLLQLAPVGLALALVAGVVAVAVSGGDDPRGEQEVPGGTSGAGILHYVVRETWGEGEPSVTSEHWQLEDGSRARTISHYQGDGPLKGTTSEDVVTPTETLAYRPSTEQGPASIIRYRESDDFASIPEEPPAFAAPIIGGSGDVGDPRTLPDRVARGDEHVRQLEDGTVRDIPVERFQVGDCGDAASREQKPDADGVVKVLEQATVALARDTHVPVRVELAPCSSDLPPILDRRVLDYLTFEELDASPENLKQLELSPHPGVPVVDGIEIDKAEERDEAGPQPSATPFVTPTPPAG